MSDTSTIGISGEEEEYHDHMMSRQANLVGETRDMTALIIGAGSIGSNAADLFVSMGIRDITLIDPDIVLPENEFPGQYNARHVGTPKVHAVAERLREEYSHGMTLSITAFHAKIEDTTFETDIYFDIVLVCTDNMVTRRYALEMLWNHCDGLWLDARMGGPSCVLYCVRVDDDEKFEFLSKHDMKDVTTEMPCGDKATAYLTTGFMRGLLGIAIRDHSRGVKPPYQQIIDAERLKWFPVK